MIDKLDFCGKMAFNMSGRSVFMCNLEIHVYKKKVPKSDSARTINMKSVFFFPKHTTKRVLFGLLTKLGLDLITLLGIKQLQIK